MTHHNVTINERQQNTILAALRLLRMAQEGHLLASVGSFGDDLVNPLFLPELQDYHPIYTEIEIQNLADLVNGVRIPPQNCFRVTKEKE